MINFSTYQSNYNREQSFKSSASLQKSTGYKNIGAESADYIKYIYKNIRQICRKPVEINVESGRLQEIVQSNEPCIFIMNHTKNQGKDINIAKFFNTLLYREYIYNDMAETCPRSKILANTGVLKRQPDGGEKFQWLGVVPVNAGINEKGKSKNKLVLRDLANQLINNKINLFLFPEGAMAMLTFLPLKYKFQPGTAWFVKNILEAGKRAKVIPLGIAHDKNGSAIHIGEPVYFRKEDGKYFVSKGNVKSDNFDKDLSKLYTDKDEIMLTKNQEPVSLNEVVPYISGVLVRNLECCTKDAQTDLKNSQPKVFII